MSRGPLSGASAQASTAQTDKALVAAIAGASIAVTQVYIMADTAMTVTIEEGSTRKWETYCGVNGGAVVTAPPGQYLWIGTEGAGLTFTSSVNGNVFVNVLYAAV